MYKYPETVKVAVQITPPEYRRLSDEELIRRYAELHETSPAIHLYERYAYIIYGICLNKNKNALAAKKQVEDIFLQMLQFFTTAKIKSFKPWLLQFFRNYFNEKKEIKPAKEPELPYEEYYATLSDEAIEKGMASLTKDEQRCMGLFYTDKKTYEEIAMETGYPATKVRQLLQKGNQDIKTYLRTNYLPNL